MGVNTAYKPISHAQGLYQAPRAVAVLLLGLGV